MPDSSATTYPMGASLADILFSFVLENISSAMHVDWGPPLLSLVVCYIFHLLIPLPCKIWFCKDCNKKLQKSCSRCNKNTWHVESSYTLQPPKYLLLFVNRFRYINNNVTKDRCSIPMDTTVMLGPLKFSLQAIIDHHGPSIHSGHNTASINCCKKTFYCNDNTIAEFGIIDSKNSSTVYVILYELIDIWVLDSADSLIAAMALAHPLHPIDNRSRNRRQNLWVGWCVSSWWPLFPSRSSVLVYIYIYIYAFFMSPAIGRIYTYNRSVIQYWWSCTPSHSIGL